MADELPPRVIGIDMSSKPDETSIAVRAEGFTRVCIVPKELGYVTKLENRGGKVVATTASGIEMIVPSEPLKDGARAVDVALFSNVGDPEKW